MPPTGTPPAAITPQGVRDGDPQVLAALAARRGPAVLAFAEAICEPAYVVRVGADAFARFRAAVADPNAGLDVHPDALLLRCVRRAALDMAPRGPDLGCIPAIELLATRAERTIKPADATLLKRHLETCEHCRDLADRLDAGDRAYRDADESPLPPEATAPMVAALAAAAPIAPAAIPSAETNGGSDGAAVEAEPQSPPDVAVAEPEPVPDEPEILAGEVVEEIRTEPVTVEAEPVAAEPQAEPVAEEPEPEPVAGEPVAGEPEHEPAARRLTGTRASYYELPPVEPRERGTRAKRGAAAAAGGAAALSRRAGAAARKRLERAPKLPAPAPRDKVAAAEAAPSAGAEDTTIWGKVDPIEFPAQQAVPGQQAMPEPELEPTPLPEPELQESAARAAARHYRRLRHSLQEREAKPPTGKPPRLPRPNRERHHLPLSDHGRRDLALPAGLVVLAALVIMAVSGVFGGGSATPPTGTQANAAPEVSLVSQSATSMSLDQAQRIEAGAPARSTAP